MIKEVLYLAGNSQKKIIYLFFGYIAIAMLDVVSLALVIPFISIFFKNGNIPIFNINVQDFGYSVEVLFVFSGLVFILIFLLRAILAVWINYKILNFSKSLDVDIRMKLLKAYQSMSVEDFNCKNTSDYIFTINSRVTELTNGVIPKALRVASDLVVLLLISSFLATIEPKVVVLTIIVLFVFGYFYIGFFKPYLVKASSEYQINGALMNKALQDGVRGIKEVKVYGASKYFINKMQESSTKLGKSLVQEELISLSPRLFLEFILVFLVLTISYSLLINNSNIEHTVSVLTIFGIASMRLMPIASNLIGASSTFKFSRKSIKIIYNEVKSLNKFNTNTNTNTNTKYLDFDSIELKDISFSYAKNNTPVLKEVNFKINKGDVVGVYGKSGSGKSTLIDLIMGLLTPTNGTVLINNQPVKGDILGLFSYMPQQISITNDSIKQNIAFGLEEAEISKHKVESAIINAKLKEFVDDLPEGLDTNIGENGVRISGGQRQRIAIARVFYHNRQIIIMDESTSALDSETESEIIKEIDSLKGVKTIILISHNKDTLSHCDYILNINNSSLTVSESILKNTS